MFAGAAVCVGGPRSGHTHARRPSSVVRGGALPRATGYGPRTTTAIADCKLQIADYVEPNLQSEIGCPLGESAIRKGSTLCKTRPWRKFWKTGRRSASAPRRRSESCCGTYSCCWSSCARWSAARRRIRRPRRPRRRQPNVPPSGANPGRAPGGTEGTAAALLVRATTSGAAAVAEPLGVALREIALVRLRAS